MIDEIGGTIERVTFHNADDGFCVLRVRSGSATVITVVGHVAMVAEGESLRARGTWRDDPTYGRQFAAEVIHLERAHGRAAIEAFLGSGAIRGVGPSTASLMYVHFRDEVFDVLDQTPERLRELPGIGVARAKMIAESWNAQKQLRELMLFLTETGIGLTRVARISKHFGPDAVRLIRENPYRLAQEIRGIGFATADAVALKLGLPRDSLERMRAGVVHALSEASLQGHCGLDVEKVIDLASRLLAIPKERIGEAIVLEVEARRLVRDTIGGKEAVFLPRLFRAEKTIADGLRRLLQSEPPWRKIDAKHAIAWVESKTGLRLAPSQREAIETVLRSKVSVITGGPGVGKTTLVNSILRILVARDVDVLLAAPTGRAAKRLAESTGRTAKTIHRLLEMNPQNGQFARNRAKPLDCDLLVIDEASMVDAPLMAAVADALPNGAALLLVGDVDQLPAVGPGQVLSDIIASGAVPVIRLTEVFRQAAESRIIVSAHAINEGRVPELRASGESDFYFVKSKEPASRIVELVTRRIPERFGFDPLREIQVLAPMRKTAAGVVALNAALQAALNRRSVEAATPRIVRFGTAYFAGDKVMQTINDYDKDVFNGDIGVIAEVEPEQGIVVDFDGHAVEYEVEEMEDLALSYATTIHKSQGSEYPAVVVALTTQHAIMLQRNLLYTAITRGKKLVVVVGEEAAVRRAVATATSRQRSTKLREWMG